MSKPRIAVDAMGGDHAPHEIVAGALLARRREPRRRHRRLLATRRLSSLCCAARAPITSRIVHAPEAVPMDQHASQALRSAERTSLGVAVNLVKRGEADAMVSAGNSGAFLAIALIRLRTIDGSRARRSRPCGRRSKDRRCCSIRAQTSIAVPSGSNNSE